MRTSAALSALLACVVAGSAWSGSAWGKKSSSGKTLASNDAGRCTRYSERPALTGDGLRLSFENRCATPIRCTVRYQTTCGKQPATAHDESFDIEGGGEHELDATISCGDEGWRVTGSTWRCRLKPGDLETAQK
jgi:hypothetical protein